MAKKTTKKAATPEQKAFDELAKRWHVKSKILVALHEKIQKVNADGDDYTLARAGIVIPETPKEITEAGGVGAFELFSAITSIAKLRIGFPGRLKCCRDVWGGIGVESATASHCVKAERRLAGLRD